MHIQAKSLHTHVSSYLCMYLILVRHERRRGRQACIYVFLCVYAYVYISAYINLNTRDCICMYVAIRTCIKKAIQVCVCACVFAYV
jgi:hypothetical protein